MHTTSRSPHLHTRAASTTVRVLPRGVVRKAEECRHLEHGHAATHEPHELPEVAHDHEEGVGQREDGHCAVVRFVVDQLYHKLRDALETHLSDQHLVEVLKQHYRVVLPIDLDSTRTPYTDIKGRDRRDGEELGCKKDEAEARKQQHNHRPHEHEEDDNKYPTEETHDPVPESE